MGTWLVLASMLVQGQAIPAPPGEPAGPPRPRFAVGAHFSGITVNISEGSNAGFGAGGSISIPAGARSAVDLRITHLLPAGGLGVYDARWRRMLRKPPGSARPDYLAAGVAGFYYVDVTYRGAVRREDRKVSYPQMLSLAAGWDVPAGADLSVPIEASVLAHPYGLLAATASVGINWGPRPLRREP